MKKASLTLILGVIVSLISSLAMAGDLTGRFKGQCQIETSAGTKVHAFDLGPDSKAAVGAQGIKVQVLNNLTHPSLEYYDVLAIGVSLDRPNSTSDVPRLCPRAPEDRRQQCLEENRRKFPPYVPAPQNGFELVRNDGFVDAHSRRRIVEGEPIRVELMKVAVISVDDLTEGQELAGSFTLNRVNVSCSGQFVKQ